MSTRKNLLIGVATLALTIGWSAVGFAADQTFTADHTSSATAGGNTSDQFKVNNLNENQGNAFQGVKGVVSEVQNNGANSAINNGNSVSATIATGQNTGSVDYKVDSRQTASQTGGSIVTETSFVNDDNVIEDSAFQNAQGVISKAQNNGAESAINNGNAVAAAILEGGTSTTTLTAGANQAASQTAAVDGGAGNSYAATSSTNDNDIRDNAFQNTQGVMSAAQNNGPNSALNNGNSVAAVIAPGGVVDGPDNVTSNFTTASRQSATVNGNNASTETANTDTNQIRGFSFENAEGVGSALQNNGANSALNNGNTVAAVVNVTGEGQADLDNDVTATATSTQAALVQAAGGETNSNLETGSDDTNTITGDAFGNAQGVMSALQNNGANSAANNGNTVSAVIADNANGGTPTQTFGTDSTQTASVGANALSGNSNEELASDDNNALSGTSFQDAAGVMSALQNNGANSALNNGNTVSALIVGTGVGVDGSPDSLKAPDANLTVGQSATVAANAGVSTEPDGNQNLEGGGTGVNGVSDTNTMTANSFENAAGVMSALQNNGANSAINNGNTVSAIVAAADAGDTTVDFGTNSTQTALVSNSGTGSDGGSNRSVERVDSSGTGNPDTNTIESSVFGAAKGVMSAGQNNGANSAVNNGNTVAAVINDAGPNANGGALAATSSQTATVQSLIGTSPADGNLSEEARSPDSNTISGSAFTAAQGVGSVVQNNGANSALNNGNTVSAIITDGSADSVVDLTADGSQLARVLGGPDALNTGLQTTSSHESNLVTGNAFNQSQGVFSALQNNGPNSAINNGNTVAAMIASCTACVGTTTFDTTGVQTSFVAAGSSTATTTHSDSTNTIAGTAFANAVGVYSVTQNNGANSAISNGNTVSAVIINN